MSGPVTVSKPKSVNEVILSINNGVKRMAIKKAMEIADKETASHFFISLFARAYVKKTPVNASIQDTE